MYSLIGATKLNGVAPGLARRRHRPALGPARLQAPGVASVALAAVGGSGRKDSLTARRTNVYSIDHVAKMIGESSELVDVVSWESDNIDDGGMMQVHDGTDESLTTFADGGEGLLALLADVRNWDGGIRRCLLDEQCDPDVFERIIA